MPPPQPPRRDSPSLLLARVAPLISRWVERLLAEQDPPLTLAQYLALEALDAGQGNATELARGAAVSRSAVSQLVAAIEGMGLIDRREGEPDRRRRTLALSREGERVLRSSRALLRRRLDRVTGALPLREGDGLARGLTRVEEQLRGTAPPRRPPPRRPPPQ